MSRDLFTAGGGNTTKQYDLPLEKFEVTYIEKATDSRELEKIIKVLRSGSEGVFPHLERAAEKRLADLDPDSRVLRRSAPAPRRSDLPASAQDELGADITDFLDDISNVDQLLRKRPAQYRDDVPVRTAVKINKENVASNKSPKPRDYREWDKLEKTIDTEAEKEPVDEKPVQRHADIATEVNVSGKSEIEKRRMAEMDKEKGNEYYTAGDYDSAVVYYTRSLSILPTSAAYNNRALVYLKQENYSRCIADCQTVLQTEPRNVKALLRRGSAYKAQSEYSKAKRDFTMVLDIEPQNLRADKLLKETENAWRTKGKKLKIDEVEGDEEEVGVMTNGLGTNGVESGKNKTLVSEMEVDSEKTKVETAKTEVDNETKGESEKQKPRRIVIEESSGSEDEDDVKEEVSGERTSSSDAASVKTASTDISSDSDLTSTSTDPSPLHQPVIPDRPILQTLPLPPELSQRKETGNNAFRSGQFAEALKHYTAIIEELSKNPEQIVNLSTLFNNRATAHFKVGDCKSAIEDCNKSLELVPHGVKALLRRASAFEVLEKYKEAYRDFKHVLAVDTTVDQAQFGLGRCRSMLFNEYGREWRTKVPDPVVNSFEIPLIIPDSSAVVREPVKEEPKPVEQDLSDLPPLEDIEPEVPKLSPAPKKPEPKKSEPKVEAKEPKVKLAKTEQQKSEPKVMSKTEKQKSEPEVTKTEQQSTKVEATKSESKEEQHEVLKAKGNQHVGKGQFKEAIVCYSKCLELFQDRSAVYTNRALCYLKTNEAARAISDCDKAIQIDDQNVKAWFRRAQGRKMENDLRNSMSDLLQVLRIDSSNSAAKKELEIVKKAYQETYAKQKKEEEAKKAKETKSKTEDSKKKKKPVIEVMSETKSPEKPKTKETETTVKEPKPSSQKKGKEFQKKNKKGVKVEPPAAAPLPPQGPSVPRLQNAESPYEFMQAWNSLKGCKDFAVYAGLLDQIHPRHLTKLLGNKMDYDILSTILRTIHDHTLDRDVVRTYHLLHHLRHVERFDMATMFMSNLDKVIVREALDKMAQDSRCPGSKTDLNSLTKAYKV